MKLEEPLALRTCACLHRVFADRRMQDTALASARTQQ